MTKYCTIVSVLAVSLLVAGGCERASDPENPASANGADRRLESGSATASADAEPVFGVAGQSDGADGSSAERELPEPTPSEGPGSSGFGGQRTPVDNERPDKIMRPPAPALPEAAAAGGA